MSGGIPKPWILRYLHQYIEKHHTMLSDAMHKKNKAQIKGSPSFHEEWIWITISDKEHYIPARLSKDALQPKDQDDDTFPLAGKGWALVNVDYTKPALLLDPRDNNNETIVLEISKISVIGSEGESPIGRPQDVRRDVRVRRWIEELKDCGRHASEHLKDTRNDVEQFQPVIPQHSSSLTIIPSNHSETNMRKSTKQPPDMASKRKQWLKQMEQSGLVAACAGHQPSEAQLQELQSIEEFGLDLRDVQAFTVNGNSCRNITDMETFENAPYSAAPKRPTTPDQWSSSQDSERSDGDHGTNDASYIDELPKEDSYISNDEAEMPYTDKENKTASPVIGQHIESKMMQHHHIVPTVDGNEEAPCQITLHQPQLPTQKLLNDSSGGVHVLVPDSDFSYSHSQSQSQSVTQKSTVNRVIPEAGLEPCQSRETDQCLHEQASTVPPKGFDTSNTIHSNQLRKASPDKGFTSPKNPSARESVGNSPNDMKEDGPTFDALHPTTPRKRRQTHPSLSQHSSKRSKGGAVIEETGHDPNAWKIPSFSRLHIGSGNNSSHTNHGPNTASVQYKSSSLHAPPESAPGPKTIDVQTPSTGSKLSGWRPELTLPKGKGIMTWDEFNQMLYKVLEIRKEC